MNPAVFIHSHAIYRNQHQAVEILNTKERPSVYFHCLCVNCAHFFLVLSDLIEGFTFAHDK